MPPESSPPENPFGATGVGMLYDGGRPYHHPRTLGRVLARVRDGAIERALDVACGTGMSAVALAATGATVVGLDRSPEMLRAARHLPGVSYLLGEAERMPFPDRCFDAVTCSSGVHWFDQDVFFAEVARVLRPRGWIALYDHYFVGMDDEPAFTEWVRELFARYPLPPRNPQVGDPRSTVPNGFETVANELFDDPIEMTHDELVDYQLTVSHCVAAVERGTPRGEVRAWLTDSTAPFYARRPLRTVRFLGSITCLRVLAQHAP